MDVAGAVAQLLKREGVNFLIAYPTNQLIESAAEAGIRTVIVRQERVGLHMADAVGRVTSGDTIGVFAMQQGPGVENSYGAVAQAFAESAPILVLPAGVGAPEKQREPELQLVPQFSAHHQVGRTSDRS